MYCMLLLLLLGKKDVHPQANNQTLSLSRPFVVVKREQQVEVAVNGNLFKKCSL